LMKTKSQFLKSKLLDLKHLILKGWFLMNQPFLLIRKFFIFLANIRSKMKALPSSI